MKFNSIFFFIHNYKTKSAHKFTQTSAAKKDEKEGWKILYANEFLIGGGVFSNASNGERISAQSIRRILGHIKHQNHLKLAAAAKASWNKPDINDHLNAGDYQTQWKNVNG
ncbi:hypothetical protein RCL_jg25522.t1 [Rhizophagus clarus]|uniref:Uncharacterized protein n=1 Tax=Rhizophagus clarus TaxID=94130 RepID=A0A8H3LLT5_9GLOM|nr:hypothetical protein RCL_jg25522.t1 [Rhizophagus clarus]